MPVIVPDIAELELLDILVLSWGDTLVLKLYRNDLTPGPATELGDFNDANYSGYAAQEPENWTAPVDDGTGRAISEADTLTFTHNGGGVANNVYGYYVVNAGGDLLWCERFGTAPLVMASAADSFTLRPKLTLRSQF